MAVDLQKSPDYDTLVGALLEKTKAGKLDWQTTANECSFISAVKGKRTFEVVNRSPLQNAVVRLSGGEMASPEGDSMARARAGCRVKVRGPDGELLLETPQSQLAEELYEVARRIALRVDENIDSTVQLLETL
jgi:hypothetical protein